VRRLSFFFRPWLSLDEACAFPVLASLPVDFFFWLVFLRSFFCVLIGGNLPFPFLFFWDGRVSPFPKSFFQWFARINSFHAFGVASPLPPAPGKSASFCGPNTWVAFFSLFGAQNLPPFPSFFSLPPRLFSNLDRNASPLGVEKTPLLLR